MDEKQFRQIIEGCQRMDRVSQKALFDLFYNYAMSIAIRYSANFEDAEEVVDDAFIKVFSKFSTHYSPNLSFKAWLRRVIINTGIDRLRLRNNRILDVELNEALSIEIHDFVIENMTYKQILEVVQSLPIPYRTVFNMYVVDGYTHPEIADILNISEGTSKSTLSRARFKLQQLINRNIYG
jgi:RNA polymerase sigma factor (sigma-70 family)